MIRWLNDLTGGNLLLWKVVAATIVFALAGLQVALAARFFEVARLPLGAAAAARVHKVSGTIAIALALVVAYTCLAGPAGPVSPTRVLLHSVLGSLVFLVLALKFTLLKLVRSGQRLLPWVGSTLFLVFGGIWATTVADYVTRR